jgi:hypothetical protein
MQRDQNSVTAPASPLTATINTSNTAAPSAAGPTFSSGGAGGSGAGSGAGQNSSTQSVGPTLPQALASAALQSGPADFVPLGPGLPSPNDPASMTGSADSGSGSQTGPQFADAGGMTLTGSGKLELENLLARHYTFLPPN